MRRAMRRGIGGGPASCVMGGVKAMRVVMLVGIESVEGANCGGCWIFAGTVGVEGSGCAVQHEGVLWTGDLCLGQWSQEACLCSEAWRHVAVLRDMVSRHMVATMIWSVRFILAPLDVAACEVDAVR